MEGCFTFQWGEEGGIFQMKDGRASFLSAGCPMGDIGFGGGRVEKKS